MLGHDQPSLSPALSAAFQPWDLKSLRSLSAMRKSRRTTRGKPLEGSWNALPPVLEAILQHDKLNPNRIDHTVYNIIYICDDKSLYHISCKCKYLDFSVVSVHRSLQTSTFSYSRRLISLGIRHLATKCPRLTSHLALPGSEAAVQQGMVALRRQLPSKKL